MLISFAKDQINLYQRSIRKNYNEFLNTYTLENNGIKTVTQAFNQLKETKSETEAVKNDFRSAIMTTDKVIKDSSKIVESVRSNPMFATDLEKETAEKVDILLDTLKVLQNTLIKLEKIISKTENLNEVIDLLEPKIQILEEQLNEFTELASLGLTAEAIGHEFASIGARLAEKASFYSLKLQNKKLTDSDIYILIEYINTTVNGLNTQLKHLDPALKYARDTKTVLQLSVFFDEEKEYYKNRFSQHEINYNIKIQRDFSIKINKGKLVQVVDNLLNNSEYWLLEKKKNEPSFKPTITIKIEEPWIYISDNGYGITPAIENQIFEPFVTTKPKGNGRGLGLFIVQQLLDSFKCGIILEPTLNENNRKYIFAINFSNILEN